MGVVLGDHIIEERLLRAKEEVTVGQGARNTFVVPSGSLPRSYPLLMVAGETYVLRFSDGMDGRLTVGGRVLTFLQLKQNGLAKRKGPFWFTKLELDAKGKVVIGDVTVLFQFVNAPPVRPKAQLPAFIRGGMFGGLEMTYGACLGGSLLVQAGVMLVFLLIDKPDHISGTRFKTMARVEVKRQVQKLHKHRVADEGDGMGAGASDMAGMEAAMAAPRHSRGSGRKGPRARADRGAGHKPARLAAEDEAALGDALNAGTAVAQDSGQSGFHALALGTPCHGPNCKGRAVGGGDALAHGTATTNLDGAASRFGAAGGGGPGGPGGSGHGSGRGHGLGHGTGRVGRGIGAVRGVPARPRIHHPRGPRPRMSASVPKIGGNVPASLAEKIRRRMRSKVYGLKRVYNTFIQTAKFKCSAKIGFMLNKSGHLSSVSVGGNCPGNFKSAIKRKVGSWHLPAGGSGFFRISVSFTY